MSQSTCSLIISTYNWPDALRLCLISVRNQTVLPQEVIIADDGSRDDTLSLIEQFQKSFPVPIIHIWQEDQGFKLAQIRNKAFAAANYPYLIQIDGDVILHQDFIKDHLHFAKASYLLQGGRVMLGPNTSKDLLSAQNIHFNLFNKDNKRIENGLRIPFLAKYLLERYRNSYPVYYARGANMSFWKKDIFAVNGYNERFEGWGHEDSDLTLRMMNAGIKKRIIKFSAIVYHLYHPEKKNQDEEKRNKLILEKALKDGIIRSEFGIDQYSKYDPE